MPNPNTAASFDIIKEAKRIVDDMKESNKLFITTSQIRKFLAAVNRLENRYRIYKNDVISETGKKPDKLPADLAQEIRFLQVKLLYQVGRESSRNKREKLDRFYRNICPYIEGVGDSPEKFEDFCRLMEAITAFHKFEGGGE